ncbi:MAG: hypothetical protein K0U60_02885 [Actinomycetia bacterium]|nr:hypothetical protein [Actinomycetes bacterium]MCH9800689.1 hypothetical protein [Actinomycetes bacterium]
MNDEPQPHDSSSGDQKSGVPAEELMGSTQQPTEQITEQVATTDQSTRTNDWEQRYYRERTLTRVFMATTAAAVLLFTGAVAYAVATDPNTGQPGAPGESYRDGGNRDDRGGPGRHGGPGGPDGQRWQGPNAGGVPVGSGSDSTTMFLSAAR